MPGGVASLPYLRGRLRQFRAVDCGGRGWSMIFSARAQRCSVRKARAALRAALLVATTTLAGCGMSDSFFVDPGHYAAYHCKELITESQNLASREKQLRDLMDKASEGTGGSVIGALSYRSDYEIVLEQQKALKRAVAEQKCELTPSYSSDRIIH